MTDRDLSNLSNKISEKKALKEMESRAEERHSESLSVFRNSIESVVKSLGRTISVKVENQVEPRDSVDVRNLSEIQFPKSVKVENIKDIKIPEQPKEVSIKKPSWLSFSGIEENIKSLRKAVIDLSQFDFGKYTKKQNAIAVRLVTKDGDAYYNAGGNGGGGPVYIPPTLTERLDVTEEYIYEGQAIAGGSDSSQAWRISRFDLATYDTLWADGNTEYDNVWDNRATLSYS